MVALINVKIEEQLSANRFKSLYVVHRLEREIKNRELAEATMASFEVCLHSVSDDDRVVQNADGEEFILHCMKTATHMHTDEYEDNSGNIGNVTLCI